MEESIKAIILLVSFWGGIALIGWFFEQIGKWNNERKSKIRDEVANEILPHTNINTKTIELYKNKLKRAGYGNNQEDSRLASYYRTKGYRGRCPSCERGYLRVVEGRYGKFVGCSTYPDCHYTTKLAAAKRKYKEESNREFFELFNSAYQA